jgi:eukaryotic-like serine/threonine-protein kinase
MLPSSPVDPLFLSFQLALAGRYSIDRELGRGGMGIVYLAREVHLERPVAIKLIPPDKAAQPSLRERFLREARLAAKLSHPNIIPIHAVEEVDGFIYYVMAFVDGETLTHRVRSRGPLSSAEGARVLREVAWALAAAHAQGLVHRDVKPDNILLEHSTGRVLVADFGIAAAEGTDISDGISGTPEFMSPEQALGGVIDARSDLYGLGATAFYAFSGRFPFEGKSATEVLAKQVTEAPPQLGSLGLTVPRKLASLVDRCLAKDPEHRPASAQVLAEQLGVAIEQRREVPAALRAFVKRYGRLDGGGTLLAAAALLTGSVVMSTLLGSSAGVTTFVLGTTLVPIAYLVRSARQLMLLGFTHADVGPAFRTLIEQTNEELAVGHRPRSALVEKLLAVVAKVSAAVMGLSILTLITIEPTRLPFPLFNGLHYLVPTLLFSGATTVYSTIGLLALRQRHSDVDTEIWSKLWMGRLGKLAFGVARKLIGKRTHASAMTHRATELSLGMAAEQLFENLPKESRKALGDLPALLARLQNDAQALRKRYDDVQEALNDAGDDAASLDYADLRETRDEVHAKLRDAVGALETIRLNLLRLHAGSATVEGLTTQIGLALDVSEEIERLIAAQEETEDILKFPRQAAPTPV